MLLRSLALLALPLVLSACDGSNAICINGCTTVNQGGPMVVGSGNLKTETRPVGKFNAVLASSTVAVVIEGTGSESLSVAVDDNLLPLLTSEVKDGTLVLAPAKGKSFQGRIPVYRITVGDLRQIELSGSSTIDASKLDSSALAVSASGSSEVHLAGRTDDFTLSIRGSGSADAAELKAKRAKVVLSGSAEATVNASDALDVRISGSGSLSYIGSPKLTSSVSGSGEITRK
jgi:Putative auto-transporter adhesin, head GIN domain